MGHDIKFNISDLQSEKLKSMANSVDSDHWGRGRKYNDGKIDEKEAEKLVELLRGQQDLQKELANESDDVKNILGYSSTVSSKTEPVKTQSESQVQAQSAEQASTEEKRAVAIEIPVKASEFSSEADTPQKVVLDRYYQYRGIYRDSREPLPLSKRVKDENGNPLQPKSPEEAYKAVAAEFKGNKAYKKAIKELRKYSIDAEAKIVALEAVNESDATKSKQVKKDAKETLEEYGDFDKHTKKALNGKNHNKLSNFFNWASLRSSDMKRYRKAQAYGNNADEVASETYTKKDFTKAIGKRSPLFKEDENGFMAIEKVANGAGEMLVKRQADGSFDITALSEYISGFIGADNTLSRQKVKSIAELEAIRTAFRKQGIDLSKRDTKQLVKFCGYHVEKKDLAKLAYDSSIGALAGAAGAGIAELTQAKDILIQPMRYVTNVNTNVVNEYIGSITSKVDVIVENKGPAYILYELDTRHILMNTLKGAGIGAAIGLLASMLEYGPSEEEIFSRGFECTTYEDFVRMVDARDNLKDDQKAVLKYLAFTFIDEKDGRPIVSQVTRNKLDKNGAVVLDKNGKPVKETVQEFSWNCQGFKDFLNRMAGYSSNLNRIELLRGLQAELELPRPVDTPTPNPNPVIIPVQNPVQEDKNAYIRHRQEITPFDKFKDANRHSWPDLTKMYSCLNTPITLSDGTVVNMTEKQKIRFLKVMQGFKSNDFTFEQIWKIVEVSRAGYKINAETKAAIKALDFITDDNFDVDMFAAHVNTPGAVGDDNHDIIAIRQFSLPDGSTCERDDSKVTRTIDRNPKKGANKGTTADSSTKTIYEHKGHAETNWTPDKDKAAQDAWAEEQRRNKVKVHDESGK